jgi:hypothetical protein
MQQLARSALDQIVDLHGIPDLKWAVTHGVAGVAALPVILLPAAQRRLPEATEAVSTRFATCRVLPTQTTTLLFVLGQAPSLAGQADAVAIASSRTFDRLPLVLACGVAWRPFWQLTLEHGRLGVTAFGLSTLFSCVLDDVDRHAIGEFAMDQ